MRHATHDNATKIIMLVNVEGFCRFRVIGEQQNTGWGKKTSHILNFYYGNAVAVIRLV